MLSKCPGCGYDLAGLSTETGRSCPECGGSLDEQAAAAVIRQKAKPYWLLALCSPLLALPSCLVLPPAQFLVSWLLASYFTYRATHLAIARGGEPEDRALTAFIAVAFGLAWAVLTSFTIWVLALHLNGLY